MSEKNVKKSKKKMQLWALLGLFLSIFLCLAAMLFYVHERDEAKKESGEKQLVKEKEEPGKRDNKNNKDNKEKVQKEDVQKSGGSQTRNLEKEDFHEQIMGILNKMSMEEKVAQMFIITPEALTGAETVVFAGDVTRESIQNFPVGGVIYFSKNLENPQQVKEMINNTQKYSKERTGLPMFISVDEEGGTVTRFGKNANFQIAVGNMCDIGASGDVQKAYEIGTVIGGFLYELGFNMDNAPVADVMSNPDNTVIQKRSFGWDCNLVSDMVMAELQGLADEHITGVLKHYPGHGATAGDTHNGYAYTNSTLEEMKENELVPFMKGIEGGAKVIMAAHISCPTVTGDGTPASLSKKMIQEILREDLGYQGLVVTDAMNMGAIAESYSSADAAVQAILAGVDLLLMPADFQSAYQGVLQAVADGRISENKINGSLYRIISLKLEIMKDSK